MWNVLDRNIVMQRMTVFVFNTLLLLESNLSYHSIWDIYTSRNICSVKFQVCVEPVILQSLRTLCGK
jgi:hypothetical protein